MKASLAGLVATIACISSVLSHEFTDCDGVYRVKERWSETEELFEELRPDVGFAHVAMHANHVNHRAAGASSSCFNALHNKAAALQGGLLLEEAEGVWRQAVSAAREDEQVATSLHRLGVIQHSLGRSEHAQQSLIDSITRVSTCPATWLRLGLLLHGMRGPTEAARAMYTAVRLLGERHSDDARRSMQENVVVGGALCYYILQETLREAMDADSALHVVREGARRFPHRRELLCRQVVASLHVCDWRGYEAMAEKLEEVIAQRGSAMLNCLTPWDSLYVPLDYAHVTQIASAHARDLLRLVGAGGVSVRAELKSLWPPQLWVLPASRPAMASLAPTPQSPRGTTDGRGVLRIGYVSSHLNHWACGRDMLHILRLHDRSRVRSVCYPLSVEPAGGRGEVWQQRIREQCGEWVEGAGMGDGALARRINADGIHVLVNLNGWISGHRSPILALRPAPIQVGYKDFPGSFGAGRRGMRGEDAIVSHLLLDHVAAPPELAVLYGEAMLFVPHSFHANAHRYLHDPPPSTDADRGVLREKAVARGAPNSTLLLGNFNSLYKLSPSAWRTWQRLLDKCDQSCALWMLRWSEAGAQNLEANDRRHQAQSRPGRAVLPRVVLTELLPEDEHVRVKGAVDLFLDTPSYNAHGTLADALWMLVPAVSLPGVPLAARIAASMLRAAGPAAHTLLVRNLEDYEAVALRLGKSSEWRRRLRASMVPPAPSHRWREAQAAARDVARGAAAWHPPKEADQRLPSPPSQSRLFDLTLTVDSLERGYAALWELFVQLGAVDRHHLLVSDLAQTPGVAPHSARAG